MSETPKAKIPRKIVKIRYITSKNIYTYKISRIQFVCREQQMIMRNIHAQMYTKVL